jgi:hypothetical protein
MARTKGSISSPKLVLDKLRDGLERAQQSDSGACLIADRIKAKYPHLTGVRVDMTTIRVSDRRAGYRYIYLTPDAAQFALLGFDQGWDALIPDDVVIRTAVQVLPLVEKHAHGLKSPSAVAQRRVARKAAAEAKVAAGEPLTTSEKAQLARDAKGEANPRKRASSTGKARVQVRNGGHGDAGVTVHGGQPRRQGPAHPNLLRGAKRHYGAKLAHPGRVWQQAVDEAVELRLASDAGLEAGQ